LNFVSLCEARQADLTRIGITLDDFLVCEGLTDDDFVALYYCAFEAESEEELQACIEVTQFTFEDEE
jgi:hypothetical protein